MRAVVSDSEKYREGRMETRLQRNSKRRKAGTHWELVLNRILIVYLWYKGPTRDTAWQKLKKQK